jgi:hypothetical protein
MKANLKGPLLLACFLVSFIVKGQDKIIEAAISAEFEILRNYAMEPLTKLQFDYTKNVSSLSQYKNRIIIINIPQVKDMIVEIGERYKKDIIRLVVAHELAHQSQYTHHSNVQGGLLYECQADIIAGFLIYQMLVKDIMEWVLRAGIQDMADSRYKRKVRELNDLSHALLDVIFGQGGIQGHKRTHPSNEERRLALRDGFHYGNAWLYGEFLPNLQTTTKPVINVNERKKIADRYKQLMNYLPGDNLITWSMRQVKKIIHEHVDNCKDLVVYTDINWDTSPDNPYIYYEQIIKNTGSRIVTLNYNNQIYTAKRTDSPNTLYWDLNSANAYSFSIKPGLIHKVNDSLKWYGDKELMPTFVYLGRKGALFSCTTLGDKKVEPVVDAGNHFADPNSPNDRSILDIYLSTRSFFSSYINSIGFVFTERFDRDIFYFSRIEFPSAISTEIEFVKRSNRYDLRVDFYSGTDKLAAENSLKKILKICQENQLITKEDKDTINPPGKKFDVFQEGEIIGRIQFYKFEGGKFSTTFVIFGTA